MSPGGDVTDGIAVCLATLPLVGAVAGLALAVRDDPRSLQSGEVIAVTAVVAGVLPSNPSCWAPTYGSAQPSPSHRTLWVLTDVLIAPSIELPLAVTERGRLTPEEAGAPR
jgi:hypothetical protein